MLTRPTPTGPFLAALREGAWVLLDELNLASQSVLEGLNGARARRPRSAPAGPDLGSWRGS